MRNTFLMLLLAMAIPLGSSAQDNPGFLDKVAGFPNKVFKKTQERADRLQRQLDRQTEKYLNSLSKQEGKLRAKLMELDPQKAAALFANNPQQQYAALLQKLKGDTNTKASSMGPEYLPNADTLHVTMAFLGSNPQLLSNPILAAQANGALASLDQLGSKLQVADQIKQYIQQRRDQIRQALSGEAGLPPSVTGMYSNYNKQLYYYSQQVREYREMLDEPDKLVSRAVAILEKLPAFTGFMARNSFLSGLFSLPGGYGSATAVDGLQTRDQVLAMIQSQVGSGGPNAASALSSSLQSAQADIQKLQDKIGSLGGGSGDMPMPDFRPSQTKTKTFLQRLEYNSNLQTSHGSYYFPVTTDVGLGVGYKVSDKSSVGIGASYKIGWGKDFQHIGLSSQGASLRSYLDVQAKKGIYASGGFEYNYQPLPGIDLGRLQSWTKSGLIGVSKIVSMKTKFFKQTKASLLWDFLSYQQLPRTQPLVFRVGYVF